MNKPARHRLGKIFFVLSFVHRSVKWTTNCNCFTSTVLTLNRQGSGIDMKYDPMTLFKDRNLNFELLRDVALDVLSVPAGEAPSERIFSIASRVMGTERGNLSAHYLTRPTFIKKNRRALSLTV